MPILHVSERAYTAIFMQRNEMQRGTQGGALSIFMHFKKHQKLRVEYNKSQKGRHQKMQNIHIYAGWSRGSNGIAR